MALTFSSKAADTAFEYAKALLVPVTKTSFTEAIEEHPFYPSLYSISNVFERYGIQGEAYRIEDSPLEEIPVPFIAYINTSDVGKDFALVTAADKEKVTYHYNKKQQTIGYDEFVKKWEKIAFIAQPSEKSGEVHFEQNKVAEKKQLRKTSLLIAGSFLAFLSCIASALNAVSTGMTFSAISILLIKLAGITATILLLVYDIDKTNSFIKNICTAGKQTNCDAVLNSKASRIFGMSWGEIGFFYFASTTLLLLLPVSSFAIKASLLTITTAFAAPYILFSVYYQWKVVKKWCLLCLWVQAVLAMEIMWAAFSFGKYDFHMTPDINIISMIMASILFPVVVWFTVKPLLKKAKEQKLYKAAYKRLLYNPDIFQSFLLQQPDAAPGYENLGITLGNPNASTTIIKVCNPYCGPCASAHPELEEIIQRNNDIKLKVIFTSTNNEGDKGGQVARHLLAIAEKDNSQLIQKALDDWYMADKKDYEVFAGNYPMNGEVNKQATKIEAMRKWCDESEIMYTPTIFINGKRLPENYLISELKQIF